MDRVHSDYRKGYLKAIMDFESLLERSESVFKALKINNIKHIRKLLKFEMQNIDRFIDYGDMTEFYIKVDKNTKDKTFTFNDREV